MIYFNATVDGKPLSEVSPQIVLYDIVENASGSTTATPKAVYDGSHFVRSQRSSLSVSLRIAIREQGTEERMRILSDVQTWARGRILTRSDRPDQELLIDHVQQPVMQSALQWTGYVDVIFTVYVMPFWRGSIPEETTITGAGYVTAPGSAERCTADVTITPTGGTLTKVIIQTAESSITLEGISIPAGESIVIDHDEGGYIRIMHGSNSLLIDRTVDSSDDLYLPTGRSEVSVTGNVDVSAVFSVRGAWL